MQFLENTNTLCLLFDEFVVPEITGYENYKKMKRRENIIVHGRGGNGNKVLIEYETLPQKYKRLVVAKYGDPYEYHAKEPLRALVKNDHHAREFYKRYTLQDGRPLPVDTQAIYSRQCDWLNMIIEVLEDKATLKEELHISIETFWSNVIDLYTTDKVKNKLPRSKRRLQDKLKLYTDNGYVGLISSKYCNQNTRKVDEKIERLLMALYCMPEKPYLKTICGYYQMFIDGGIRVVDLETAEVFNPKDFYVKGKPYEVKESTIKYYIERNPINRAVVDKVRMSALEWASKHKPHHIRKAPTFSFSKITMDDITIPFKMPNGKRVWSYQVFDVASQAVIGVAFSKDKSVELIKDAVRDMLRNVIRNSYGMPAEVEVERHLTSSMKGTVNEDGTVVADVLTDGAIFPFVRWCAPENPMEKRAEGFIKLKKYGFQKKRKGMQFRPFARLEANRLNQDEKVVTYSYEDIVANEREDIEAYNNALHSDQVKYKGKTRKQVLEENVNPALTTPNIVSILPYIGIKPNTKSIRRGYVEVRGRMYSMTDAAKLETLTSNKVTVYYLPDEDGDPKYVHLYNEYEEPICELVEVAGFQEAKVEQTEDDRRILGKQKQYIDTFNEIVERKSDALKRVAMVSVDVEDDTEAEVVEDNNTASTEGVKVQEETSKEGGYMQKNDFLQDDELIKSRALKGI